MRLIVLSLATALASTGCTHTPASAAPPPETAAAASRSTSGQSVAPRTPPPPEGSRPLSGSVESFNAACTADLEKARAQVALLKTLAPATRGHEVLEAYDDATAALGGALSRSGLAHEVHPNAALRDAARACEQQADALNVEISQDRGVYDALKAVDLAGADAATRYWMERTLLEFRRAGVDRDDATRARVKALNEQVLQLGQTFSQNIAEDVRRVELAPEALAGLPRTSSRPMPRGPGARWSSPPTTRTTSPS